WRTAVIPFSHAIWYATSRPFAHAPTWRCLTPTIGPYASRPHLRCTVAASEIPIATADRGAHSPAVSFPGGFRTPARRPWCVWGAQWGGRLAKPVTEAVLKSVFTPQTECSCATLQRVRAGERPAADSALARASVALAPRFTTLSGSATLNTQATVHTSSAVG